MRYRYSTEGNGKLIKKAIVYTQDEHRINLSDVDNDAVHITERLQGNGYETYIVGGAVRDLILGKKPKDFDIVSAASPGKIKKFFKNARIIGRRFRLVHVCFGAKIYEVSTFRSIKDGPTSNTFGTIEEDVLRRDFTLNALFYDPVKQIVVDYVNGMKDIRKQIIRPIIAMPYIFTDDPVRMIRAVKYGAITGFNLPLSLRWKIRRQSGLLAEISHSRLTEEISKIIHSPHARPIIESLDALGLFDYLQPCAGKLFRDSRGFKARYLKTMDALNKEAVRDSAAVDGRSDHAKKQEPAHKPGEILAALVRDYLEDLVDWNGTIHHSISERYKNAFILARKFVLPMNPPRMELDAALRCLFAEHGVTVKKTRFSERPRYKLRPDNSRAKGNSAVSDEKKASVPVIESGAGEEPKKKRRRHKKKSGSKVSTPEI